MKMSDKKELTRKVTFTFGRDHRPDDGALDDYEIFDSVSAELRSERITVICPESGKERVIMVPKLKRLR